MQKGNGSATRILDQIIFCRENITFSENFRMQKPGILKSNQLFLKSKEIVGVKFHDTQAQQTATPFAKIR